MDKKRVLSFSAMVLAAVAIIVGLCFVFLGNKSIKEVPNSLSMQQVDGDFYVVAEYNSQYWYKFRIEQVIEGEYILIDIVHTDKNVLNLSEQNLNVVAGQVYRFSVCYSTENGGGKAGFSQGLDWQATLTLGTIDYDNVLFDGETEVLTWNKIYNADNYELRFIDSDGEAVVFNSADNSLNLSDLDVGKYQCFVVAKSENEFLENSPFGKGKEIVISRKNNIVENNRTNGMLRVKTTQKVDAFEIYVDGKIRATLTVDDFVVEGEVFVYDFDLTVLFNSIDFTKNVVQIKSLNTSFIIESDFVLIV